MSSSISKIKNKQKKTERERKGNVTFLYTQLFMLQCCGENKPFSSSTYQNPPFLFHDHIPVGCFLPQEENVIFAEQDLNG